MQGLLLLTFVFTVALVICIVERLAPARKLRQVPGWYIRAFVFNAAQAAFAVLGTYLWDRWFSQVPIFSLVHLPIYIQVLCGYLLITFIYYWWHRMRHSFPILWRFLHQLHHSPERIEVITSFYKHPSEIILNGILTSFILYMLLGLSAGAVGITVLITAVAEFIYHMNVRTPRWAGLFFQRPEMHRIHHQRGLHHFNYSDLPVWDMLFGTYRNPVVVENTAGFPDNNEMRVVDMLTGKELRS